MHVDDVAATRLVTRLRDLLGRQAMVFEDNGTPGEEPLVVVVLPAALAMELRADPIPRVELSPAETTVAELVARGLSNRRIAEQLFLSRFTVETHLKRIFVKLGLSSRAELAALVASGRLNT
jgi:DNA-binding NarL/FixJ family response regulator